MPLAIVTTGPASSLIDDVRRITNFATGEIGALLAEALLAHGFEVILFRGLGATQTTAPAAAQVHEFTTNHELTAALGQLADTRGEEVRAFFHAAALADYSVASVRGPDGALNHERKIPGDLPQLQLILEPAAKVLPRLRAWFPRAAITAWKYELESTREEAVASARQQLTQKRTDLTVLNGAAYGPGFAVLEGGSAPVHFATKRELADFLASRPLPGGSQDK